MSFLEGNLRNLLWFVCYLSYCSAHRLQCVCSCYSDYISQGKIRSGQSKNHQMQAELKGLNGCGIKKKMERKNMLVNSNCHKDGKTL